VSVVVLSRILVLGRLLLVFGLYVTATLTGRAERLPVKSYTTADGLGHNVVNRVVRDSRGFLWFCTREGLSRFDGYSFTNYGIEQGLPSAIVNDLVETREGQYWVATASGLCRFNPLGRPQASINSASERTAAADRMFAVFFPGEDARSRYFLSLLQDREGNIWCGTRAGLYRLDIADEVRFESVELGIPQRRESRFIECLLEDRAGGLWAGAGDGLFRRWPDGRVEAYTIRDGLPDKIIHSLLEDREGRIWVGTVLGGLCRLVPDPAPGHNVVARVYSDRDGLTTKWINQLFQASDGGLWAGSNRGLIQFMPTADGRDFRFRAYAEAHGLSFHEVSAMAEDGNGNLWVGMLNGGVAKIARSGLTTFGKADGFSWATSILETRAGDVLVVGGLESITEGFINRFDGEKFIPIRPKFSEGVAKRGFGWGWNQTVLEDHTGQWWIASAAGVCRFPKVSEPSQLAHTSPKAIYTTRDGLAADMILRLFEDSRGDVWISSVGHGVTLNGLSRWERSTGAFHQYGEKDALPRLDMFYVSSFAEDRAGNLWIGFSGDGGLVRYSDGRFTLLTANDGAPAGQIRNMLIDSVGRLWVATYQGGLSRIDDPAAEHPTALTYTVANGLSSNEITCVSEDAWGRIYIGTGRGIDRLDTATGRIKHYTTADGLPVGEMYGSLRDRKGALWFSFQSGVARLVPEPDPPPVPPPVLITGLRIAGETQVISALGEIDITPLKLGADKNQFQIEFVALGFSPGEGLRYQYRLEGASDDWSQLTDHRTVNFANLAPDRYRFLVRAVNADGVMSDMPASFAFTILPPIWQRWWFLTLTAALVGLIAYALYRYRVTRLIELERVRMRIATDLHDDIGSSLSQIAIMSEVVQQQIQGENLPLSRPLSIIAGTSRELVDSMADIVWAINPHRDHLIDLTQRMRLFAGDVLTARNIDFTFAAPRLENDIRLETDVRREVFLIFKEGINNAVRHSKCSAIEIRFGVSDNRLMLEVTDNGCSFDADQSSSGHGLASMNRRAESIGGALDILADAGQGTTITLQAPLRRRRLRRMKIST
jgi:ligand-binding sensor domain-containing protein/two-component sensor histidine kinase